ncbi:hypothetical protein DT73_12195 [Mangrovibacter sp. MFB070]|uniref:EAL domain-containing protein n=1 Tax=Mangrovibacter sp. MFB070 TaxID=1224318 RepID=UPI0004DACCBA|nr:EAL domain-containing protein [Mangrovibacter sp. MFB070]KEA52845.1 hypothetical protein DT73_12195 [Mangrovibacter sp. MFB070]
MVVTLECAYYSQCLFQPLRRSDGSLYGVELVTRFVTEDGVVQMPEALVSTRLSPFQHSQLLDEKVSLLRSCQSAFLKHRLVIWMPVEQNSARCILSDTSLVGYLTSVPGLHLGITEQFIASGDHYLANLFSSLERHFLLALLNYGAGHISGQLIFQRQFNAIMLDKQFVQSCLKKASFLPVMYAILNQVGSACHGLVINGIDDEKSFTRTRPLPVTAMQGALWPPVIPEDLMLLLYGNPLYP